jgi:hypothetical protein
VTGRLRALNGPVLPLSISELVLPREERLSEAKGRRCTGPYFIGGDQTGLSGPIEGPLASWLQLWEKASVVVACEFVDAFLKNGLGHGARLDKAKLSPVSQHQRPWKRPVNPKRAV